MHGCFHTLAADPKARDNSLIIGNHLYEYGYTELSLVSSILECKGFSFYKIFVFSSHENIIKLTPIEQWNCNLIYWNEDDIYLGFEF